MGLLEGRGDGTADDDGELEGIDVGHTEGDDVGTAVYE